MKKKILSLLLIGMMLMTSLTGCLSVAKSMGGSVTLKLESNQKLEEITWKDDSLWYLTRLMTEDDIAENHTFQQSTDFGVFEGTVTIVETKE